MSGSYLTSRQFWTDVTERCVRTFAQTAAAAFGTGAFAQAVTDGEWGSLPWEGALTVTVSATVLAFLTALAGKGVGDPSTASLTSGTAPQPITSGGPHGYQPPSGPSL